jgi:hypothetical protein
MVAKIDGKVFTATSENTIRDCHGDYLFTASTGDFLQTLLNGNKIWVSFRLQYANGSTLAFVEKTAFFSTNIDLKNVNGDIIANIKRTVDGLRWKWTFTIQQPQHPATDPRILTLIAGKSSFVPGILDDSSSNDMCNQFFLISGLLVLVILIVIVAGLLFTVGYNVRQWMRSRHTIRPK